eukprot:TRINITY_DN50992_c0_g1_i1.p1 TRINITY_DN50992_c0_g1~~TRINITY_DN50992_c0_g1_i1.p1  ORF type:complete len:246 (+),score=39.62 TRINITY_DN50992_c0_g1_i1:113-850(+)
MARTSHVRDPRQGLQAGRVRCVQCRRVPHEACKAFFADTVHRPVLDACCGHGPFCERCRVSVASQVLPFCVCRALVAAWREEAWPDRPGVTINGALAARVVADVPADSVTAAPASAFVSWDSMKVDSDATAAPAPGPPGDAQDAPTAFLSWDSFAGPSGAAADAGRQAAADAIPQGPVAPPSVTSANMVVAPSPASAPAELKRDRSDVANGTHRAVRPRSAAPPLNNMAMSFAAQAAQAARRRKP